MFILGTYHLPSTVQMRHYVDMYVPVRIFLLFIANEDKTKKTNNGKHKVKVLLRGDKQLSRQLLDN